MPSSSVSGCGKPQEQSKLTNLKAEIEIAKYIEENLKGSEVNVEPIISTFNKFVETGEASRGYRFSIQPFYESFRIYNSQFKKREMLYEYIDAIIEALRVQKSLKE